MINDMIENGSDQTPPYDLYGYEAGNIIYKRKLIINIVTNN